MNKETIKNIESILSNGDRVELIPVRDGIKVVRVRREEIKNGLEKQKINHIESEKQY